jgi:hypothetical protein
VYSRGDRAHRAAGTGEDLDRLAVAGLAAAAGGAALVLWSAEVKAGAKRPDSTTEA